MMRHLHARARIPFPGYYPGMELLQRLTAMYGAPTALACLAWWLERRTNIDLQKRLIRLNAAQLEALGEVRAQLEAIRESLRHRD